MPHYTHKPTEVFAIQYTGDNANEIIQEFGFPVRSCNDGDIGIGNYGIYAHKFDYIINDLDDHISVLSPERFEERYVIST